MIHHLKLLEYALSTLIRRRWKNLAVIVFFAFVIASLASILFLTQALKTEATGVLSAAPALVVQRLAAGRHEMIPADYAQKIAAIPGVGRVRPRHWGYYYDVLTGCNYTLMGIDGERPGVKLVAGRLPAGAGEVAVGAGVAEARSLAVGNDLALVSSANLGISYEVVGVFTAGSALITNDLVVMTEAELVRFFGLPDTLATDIVVEVYNETEVNTIAAKIKRLLPDSRPLSRSEILRTYDAVFNWRSGMLLAIFSSALIAFAILAWDKATGISAEEKREIGILKAIGWQTSDVLELKFWEGLAISATSLLLGLLTAYLHVFYFDSRIIAPVLKGWSVLFPAFKVLPRLDMYQVLVIAFLTIVPYVACTIVPSWKTAITDPEEVMRS